MIGRTLFSAVGAILLALVTTAIALAWPDQPPDKVLISGPGIVGQVQVKGEQALAIFRLGNLEDVAALDPPSAAPPEVGPGYKIVRFFDSGEFDFARLTYYPDPRHERGYLYFEDGPMLQGNHTPYNQTWLRAKPAGEQKLRELLTQMGAKFGDAEPASSGALVTISTSDSPLPDSTTLASPARAAQNASASEPNLFSSAIIPLVAGVAGLLGTAGALWRWRARHLRQQRLIHQ
jgi:hypothetical protein